MKNIGGFLSEIFQFLEVKFSIYLNSRVFVMNMLILAFPVSSCIDDTFSFGIVSVIAR